MTAGAVTPSETAQIGIEGLRSTRAIVDLDAVAANVRAIRSSLPASTRIMAVVKANAYGHGAPWVAASALAAGASLLGVATVGEGIRLRKAGIADQIVLLGSIAQGEVPEALRWELDITVAERRLLETVQQRVREQILDSAPRIHLKIDTGLRRYGCPPHAASALAARLRSDPLLQFAGVCTHFASADEPLERFTDDQLASFEAAIAELAREGEAVPDRHVANSAAVLRGIGCRFEIVRIGIALYGVPPSDDVPLLPGMRPVMGIESRIARVFDLTPGDCVGYNRTFQADCPMRAGLVPIGYADGYRRSFANGGWVGLNGRKARVLGRVSMDQIVIEIPGDADTVVGDVVQIMGAGVHGSGPHVGELAAIAGTNSYEILVGIRGRVPRVFMESNRTSAVHFAASDGESD